MPIQEHRPENALIDRRGNEDEAAQLLDAYLARSNPQGQIAQIT